MEQKYIVFISLLIDLLAFTLILPLLPKIFDYYESSNNVSLILTFFLIFNNKI
jgi:hypothetical protein